MSDPVKYRFTSNVVPPSDAGWALIIVDAVLIVLTTLWMAMRIYSRHVRQIQLVAEDIVHIAALVFFYGFAGVSMSMILNGGLGHHLADLPPSHTTRLLKLSFASQVLYAISLGLVKIGICLMLVRIFFVRKFVVFAYILCGLSCSWAIMTTLVGILICQPVSMNWDPTTPGGTCGDQTAAFSAVGIVDIIVDVLILVLPIPMILNLQLPTANKMGLVAIFSVGILTIIFGAVRLKEVLSVDFTDFSFSAFASHAWSVAEAGVAIIVACSVHLRPVFDRLFSGLISSLRSSRRRGSTAPLSRKTNSKVQANSNPSRPYPDFEMWPVTADPQTSVVGSTPRSDDDVSEDNSSNKQIWVRTEFTAHDVSTK
ncbi:hypothetical protein FE257_010103 [Aspergillus nanangensis]|uniref:Rhodopsin domain-containing protein n=1 Tax=Aspergillus nanangensis TaxID=2582783 RepID=A0AAD4CJ97_ASPNN|nr:hypothetical protein FE257_010103 [Aspergillus nanangensis]